MSMLNKLVRNRPRLGASIEELQQCPYDSNHWVRSFKLDDHVVKCRLNYQDDLRKKGKQSYLLTCQYNYLHKVVDAEWTFHMARCPDRKRLWSYQLMCAPLKNKFPGMLVATGEELPEEKKELWELYGGLDIGQLFGMCTYGKLVKLKDIGKDAKQLALEGAQESARALAKEVEEDWREWKEMGQAETEPEPPKFEVKYSQDEIDYWNGPGLNKGSGFNWLDHNSQPRGYNIITFPRGLTKRQRREFERKNAEEFEKRIAKVANEKEVEGITRLERFLVEEADRKEPAAEDDADM